MQKKITINDVKKALKDERFRSTLPKEIEKEVNNFLDNPSCACNIPLYKKIIKDCRDQLLKYYPSTSIPEEDDYLEKLAQNNWTVINCHISELEKKLNKLGPGRKQLDVARYQDQVTIVINELDIIF